MRTKTFHDHELESWSERAAFYDDLFADVSAQSIGPTLDTLGQLTGRKLLDVACGTGHLVAAASRRGAISEGIDFAPPMIDAARANYPGENFAVGDATQLPYEDDLFDAVTCAFGLLHMEHPQTAVHEAFRVLQPGGRFAFALWFGPEDGSELYAITKAAIDAHAAVKVSLPEAWTVLRYADFDACASIAQQAGFLPPTFKRLPIVWRRTAVQDLFRLVTQLSVRTKLVIDSQPPETQQRIHDHILSEAEARRRDGIITLAWPALLTVAQKPE